MFIPSSTQEFYIMLDARIKLVPVFLFLCRSLGRWEGRLQGKLFSVSQILAEAGVMRIKKPGSWVEASRKEMKHAEWKVGGIVCNDRSVVKQRGRADYAGCCRRRASHTVTAMQKT